MDVPVLLICFNRPNYVAKMLNSLRKCKVSKLYVFKDGPRPNNVNDRIASEHIEDLIDTIDWDCNLKTNYMQNNLGCGYGPFSAISWAFQYESKLIILEDDCIPTNAFFSFCDSMLNKYQNNEMVSLISGYSRLSDPTLFNGYDYIFSQYGVTWGWATWKRVWDDFDMQLRNMESFFKEGGFSTQFKTKKECDFFNYRYRFCKKDESLYKHVWDVQFGLYSRASGALRIVPRKSLIQYVGVDGTHYSPENIQSDVFNVKSTDQLQINNYPTTVSIIDKYDQIYFRKYVYSEYRLLFRIFNKIKRYIIG